ncbi:hypothetical protein GCM10009347_36440 [Shewanella algicola]|uniref:Uncharacterized protein n=1 Tax=Shewanella algicola TaxID=640633 RepID=A0A9X1Z6D1_9GAMM|nr:hypothetical protein [Shewanella algicola]MCL1106488.1 hypothetical protein [Shewanella algicola]GGP67625.1 hypothetical protein GCM10009347_36440 [Shewanella algicola]
MQSTAIKKRQGTRTFVPKMSNFETSSRYEGLYFKKEKLGKSIDDLKAKYAR